MTTTPIAPTAAGQITPLQLLEAQVRLLTDIKQAQAEEFEQLRQQNQHLERMVWALAEKRKSPIEESAPVTVENFNMPFWALVGMLFKFSLASIPVAIVSAIVSFILFIAFSSTLLNMFTSGIMR